MSLARESEVDVRWLMGPRLLSPPIMRKHLLRLTAAALALSLSRLKRS